MGELTKAFLAVAVLLVSIALLREYYVRQVEIAEGARAITVQALDSCIRSRMEMLTAEESEDIAASMREANEHLNECHEVAQANEREVKACADSLRGMGRELRQCNLRLEKR